MIKHGNIVTFLVTMMETTRISIILCKNYRDNCEKRCCSNSHKQFKTLSKDNIWRLKIISLYIYKDLRLRILGLMSHVTTISRNAT